MNAIIGCICYVIAFGLILIFLMRDTLMEIIKEIKMICNKLLKKRKMDMNDLKEKTILITGATGLIGQAVIKELLKQIII